MSQPQKNEGHPCEGWRFEQDRLGGAIDASIDVSPPRKPQARVTLSASDEFALIQRARAGDSPAKRTLIEAFQPLVGRIAKRYGKHAHDPVGILPDLIAEGNIGLLIALERFEIGRGLRFSTYAMWWVRSAIHDFAVGQQSIVRIRKADMKMGRLHVPDESLTISGGNDEGLLKDIPQIDDTPMEDFRARVLALDFALKGLSPRERQIFAARHLSDDPATLNQLGTELGISPERVRQLAEVALRKVSETVTRRLAA